MATAKSEAQKRRVPFLNLKLLSLTNISHDFPGLLSPYSFCGVITKKRPYNERSDTGFKPFQRRHSLEVYSACGDYMCWAAVSKTLLASALATLMPIRELSSYFF